MEKNSKQLYPEQITDEELGKYSYRNFEGKIMLIDTIEKCRQALSEISNERLFGFDTETKPSFRKGQKHKVALLQLSTGEKAYLFRLNIIGLPAGLAELLSDERIIKVGAAIHDDIKFLQSRRQFKPSGFIDLQTLATLNGIKNLGLKKLSAIVLGFKISKKQQVTDWEAGVLSGPQLLYAATDAWICYEIYKELSLNGIS
jgi:ribonuclease D